MRRPQGAERITVLALALYIFNLSLNSGVRESYRTVEIPMVKLSKSILAFLCIGVASLSAYADEFEVGEFRYEVLSYENPACRLIGSTTILTGEVVIPDEVPLIVPHSDGIADDVYSMHVTEIGDDALAYSEIVKLTLGKNVIRIGKYSFNSGILEEVNLNEKLQYIGPYAFINQSRLHNITIPDNVTEIGELAFANDIWLETAILGNSLVKIGEGAFRSAEHLQTVTFPNSLETIGQDAFANCVNLIDITFGTGLKNIGERAFEQATLLQSVTFNEELESIGAAAFADCCNLLEISIPEKVKVIEDETFRGCHVLENVEIGTNVESIGARAFWYCDNLSEINIPASVTTIGDEAFYETYSLTTVTGCAGLVSIGAKAFCGTDGMFGIRHPLTSISLSDSEHLEYIGEGAFSLNNRMTELHLPDGVKEIGPYAFSSMEVLTDISIGNSLENIPEGMCSACWILSEEFVVPESVKTIGPSAFSYCGEMKSISIGSHVESIGSGAFFQCGALTTVSIPDATMVLEDGVFAECENLKNVTIGTGMSRIKPNAFGGVELETLECRAVVPPTIFNETFSGWQYENTTLIVPDESLEAYGKKVYWRNFLKRESASIDNVFDTDKMEDQRYDINGRKVDESYKGVVIVRYSDGSICKQLSR